MIDFFDQLKLSEEDLTKLVLLSKERKGMIRAEFYSKTQEAKIVYGEGSKRFKAAYNIIKSSTQADIYFFQCMALDINNAQHEFEHYLTVKKFIDGLPVENKFIKIELIM